MTVLSLLTINYKEVKMKILLTIIIISVLVLDAWFMKKEYDKENLVGVVYWGFWTLMAIIALK